MEFEGYVERPILDDNNLIAYYQYEIQWKES